MSKTDGNVSKSNNGAPKSDGGVSNRVVPRLVYQTLSNAEWARIEPMIPQHLRKKVGGPGAPRMEDRLVAQAAKAVISGKETWMTLPPHYGSKSAAHRVFQQWCAEGVVQRMWPDLWIKYKVKQGPKCKVGLVRKDRADGEAVKS